MIFRYNTSLYPRIAVIKAAYHYTDKAYVHLDLDGLDYVVSLTEKEGCTIDTLEFENEILAQLARYKIYQQTKDLRRLSLARALASSMTMDYNKDVEDTNEEDYPLEDILKSWFEK